MRPLKRLLAQVKLERCNCLDIDDIETHAFLGIHYARVAGHSRHIQKGMIFSGQ